MHNISLQLKVLSQPTEDWGPALFRNPSEKKMQHYQQDAFTFPEASMPLNCKATIELTPIVKDEKLEKASDSTV